MFVTKSKSIEVIVIVIDCILDGCQINENMEQKNQIIGILLRNSKSVSVALRSPASLIENNEVE